MGELPNQPESFFQTIPVNPSTVIFIFLDLILQNDPNHSRLLFNHISRMIVHNSPPNFKNDVLER